MDYADAVKMVPDQCLNIKLNLFIMFYLSGF